MNLIEILNRRYETESVSGFTFRRFYNKASVMTDSFKTKDIDNVSVSVRISRLNDHYKQR
jgi:hypothetical protein